jgi:hypothetical protein
MQDEFECWMASSPALYDSLMKDHSTSSDLEPAILKDVVDGSICKNHPLFSQSCSHLQIMLYYDEVELCNALSPQSQKVGFWYWMLGNLPPEERFQFQNIRLLCLCKYADIDVYGIDAILDSRVILPPCDPGRGFGMGTGFLPQMELLSHTKGGVIDNSYIVVQVTGTQSYPCMTLALFLDVLLNSS